MENKTAITAEQIIDKVNSNLYSEVITNASRSVAIREINEFALQQTDSIRKELEKKTQVLSDIIVIKDDTIERLKEELAEKEKERQQLKFEVITLESKADKLNNDCIDLSEELGSLKDANRFLHSQIEQQLKQIADLKEQQNNDIEAIQTLMSDKEHLQSSLNKAKSENGKLVELAFNESRLTHPMLGFKHKDFNEFKQSINK